MIYKTLSLASFKRNDAGNGSFEGYGSVFGNRDDGGDIIIKGAFKEDLPDFISRGFIGLGHDWAGLPIGYIKDAHEDDYGLYISAEYHSHSAAQEARAVANERIAAGKGVYLSIGYQVKAGGAEYTEDGMSRLLKSLYVFETSQVNVPMNRLAEVTGAKMADHGESVLSQVAEFVTRVKSLAGMRASEGKEGRVLSSDNRKKLGTIAEQLTEAGKAINLLLTETEPKKMAPKNEVIKLLSEFESLKARTTAGV